MVESAGGILLGSKGGEGRFKGGNYTGPGQECIRTIM